MATHTHLSPDDIARYREIIGCMDIDDGQKDDVIRVVHGIMQAFVDISFSNDPVQISVGSRLVDSFRAGAARVNLPTDDKQPLSPALTEGQAAGLEP